MALAFGVVCTAGVGSGLHGEMLGAGMLMAQGLGEQGRQEEARMFRPLMAKFLHRVRTACILRTQRLGYSPKNTCHLSSSMAKQQSPPVVHVTPFKCPTRSTIACSCVLCWER